MTTMDRGAKSGGGERVVDAVRYSKEVWVALVSRESVRERGLLPRFPTGPAPTAGPLKSATEVTELSARAMIPDGAMEIVETWRDLGRPSMVRTVRGVEGASTLMYSTTWRAGRTSAEWGDSVFPVASFSASWVDSGVEERRTPRGMGLENFAFLTLSDSTRVRRDSTTWYLKSG